MSVRLAEVYDPLPCPLSDVQVDATITPETGLQPCPRCGRPIDVAEPSPPSVWPEHRTRYPWHLRPRDREAST